jgi:hypothetical protein
MTLEKATDILFSEWNDMTIVYEAIKFIYDSQLYKQN